MQFIDETLGELRAAAQRLDSVLVSYSGGKDSLAVMDLCVRTFKRVDAFFMEFVPGLSMTEALVEDCRARFGITVRRYLHWSTVQALGSGAYCDTHWKREIRKMTLPDVYIQARHDSGIETIATGAKRSDSIWRRRVMASSKNSVGDVIWPIAGWQKMHVLAYLNMRKIPAPKAESERGNASGVGLALPSLYFVHDNYPDDFKKIEAVFPYVRAAIERRRFYPKWEETLKAELAAAREEGAEAEA